MEKITSEIESSALTNTATLKMPGIEKEHQNKLNFDEYLSARMIDKLMAFLKSTYFIDFFEKNEKSLTKWGFYGLYVCGILGLITSLVIPLRYDKISFSNSLLIGFVYFFCCILLHYISFKFLPIIELLLKSNRSQMSSRALLDCWAIVHLIGGIITLLTGIYFWIKTSSIDSFFIGIFTFIYCEYIVSLSLKPEILNIDIVEKTSAGEEFLGVISFGVKSVFKLIPIMFGSGIIFCIINLFLIIFNDYEYIYEILGDIYNVLYLTGFALSPIVGYFLFLIYYFFLDLAKAILSMPNKVESLIPYQRLMIKKIQDIK